MHRNQRSRSARLIQIRGGIGNPGAQAHATGRRKTTAIRGALKGRLVNVLITDRGTAERLLQPAAPDKCTSLDRVAVGGPRSRVRARA